MADEEQVILVAFTVRANSRAEAHDIVTSLMPSVEPYTPITSWWVAEDDRTDGSDNDSAVFCTPGRQSIASQYLHDRGLTPRCNIVSHDNDFFDEGAFDDDPNDLEARY